MKELTNEKSTDYFLWKATKKFNRPIVQIPPLKTSRDNWARSDVEKVNACADQEERVIPYAKVAEVVSQIKNLDRNKAPGFDLINGEIMNQIYQEKQ